MHSFQGANIDVYFSKLVIGIILPLLIPFNEIHRVVKSAFIGRVTSDVKPRVLRFYLDHIQKCIANLLILSIQQLFILKRHNPIQRGLIIFAHINFRLYCPYFNRCFRKVLIDFFCFVAPIVIFSCVYASSNFKANIFCE